MAAGVLSAPGTQRGPCKGDCRHKDCAAIRQMAESICPKCDKAIGYDTRFYQFRLGEWPEDSHFQGYVHADCAEAVFEEKQ